MAIRTFLTALGLVFVAELGDKTQLTILALSARYGKPIRVFIGAAIAFVLLNGVAVGLGEVGHLLPADIVKILSSLVFIGFGLIYLTRAERFNAQDESRNKAREEAGAGRNVVLATFLLICLMELGDKTQLSMIALTTRFGSPIYVFLGGTLALLLSAIIAALAGGWLARRVQPRVTRAVAGGLFVLFGLLIAFGSV